MALHHPNDDSNNSVYNASHLCFIYVCMKDLVTIFKKRCILLLFCLRKGKPFCFHSTGHGECSEPLYTLLVLKFSFPSEIC